MMIKKYIVKKNHEFQNIINQGQLLRTNIFFIYYKKNNLSYNRIGISVGKKLSNAVIRNKTKRQIRSMLNINLNTNNNKNNSYDYIIIVRKKYFNNKYQKNKIILLKNIK